MNPAPVMPAQRPRPEPRPQKPPRPKPPPLPAPEMDAYAEVGDAVDWFPAADKGEAPQPCLVTQVGIDGRIDGSVVALNLSQVVPVSGAIHVDHPKATVDNTGGGWRARPWVTAVRKMLVKAGILKWDLEARRLVVAEPEPEPEKPKA